MVLILFGQQILSCKYPQGIFFYIFPLTIISIFIISPYVFKEYLSKLTLLFLNDFLLVFLWFMTSSLGMFYLHLRSRKCVNTSFPSIYYLEPIFCLVQPGYSLQCDQPTSFLQNFWWLLNAFLLSLWWARISFLYVLLYGNSNHYLWRAPNFTKFSWYLFQLDVSPSDAIFLS
jgi:hypothetical protein